jgi:hypothetical protein
MELSRASTSRSPCRTPSTESLMPMPLSPRALRLIKAGEILFGERYQSAQVRALGCRKPTCRCWLPEIARSPTQIQKNLKRTLQAKRKRLRGLSAEQAEIIKRIIKEQNNV